LIVLACLALSLPATAGSVAAQQDGYVLEQGDRCVELTPLEGDETAEELYDYNFDNYSSAGTADLQRENTSVLFLYEGPEGLSLVMVHGKLGGTGQSGSASFTVRGLSESAEWTVEDDNYTVGPVNDTAATDNESEVYDQWDHSPRRSVIDWTWYENRTDGGVVSGLGEDLDIQIEPRFNEDAALYDQYYYGNVTDWEVLSGDLENPERSSLTLDESVTIHRGDCGGSVGDRVTPSSYGADRGRT
jgi:hypothetical protein